MVVESLKKPLVLKLQIVKYMIAFARLASLFRGPMKIAACSLPTLPSEIGSKRYVINRDAHEFLLRFLKGGQVGE